MTTAVLPDRNLLRPIVELLAEARARTVVPGVAAQ